MPGTVKLRTLGARPPSFSAVLQPTKKTQLLRIRNRTIHFTDSGLETRPSPRFVRLGGLGAENPSLPSPRVPVEIIERILELLLEETDDLDDNLPAPYSLQATTTSLAIMEGKNPRLALISPLLLASSLLRRIALRQYFSVLILHTPAQFARACRTLCSEEAFHWVK
jgi:hypothetical protein